MKIIDSVPYFVGFWTMQIWDLWTMHYHPAKVPSMFSTLSLDFSSAHCVSALCSLIFRLDVIQALYGRLDITTVLLHIWEFKQIYHFVYISTMNEESPRQVQCPAKINQRFFFYFPLDLPLPITKKCYQFRGIFKRAQYSFKLLLANW